MNRILWVVLPVLLAPLVWALLDWAVFNAVFVPNLQACQQAAGQGACWGVVAEKWRVILFGRYPLEEQWRAGIVLVLWSVLLFATAARVFKARHGFMAWSLVLPASAVLLATGAPTNLWGGLPLTLILSTVGFGLAFPLAVLLGLGQAVFQYMGAQCLHCLHRVVACLASGDRVVSGGVCFAALVTHRCTG
jgi:general L-amino acid transport system permease protein